MSAYVVDKATIDALITAFLWLEREADGSHEPPEAQEGIKAYDALGAMLWRENHRSVDYRYTEKSRAPSYRFRALPFDDMRAAMPRVHGALRCYVYQSCEHEGWPKSRAAKWIAALEARVVALCPMVVSRLTTPAWQRVPAKWGWSISDADRDVALTAAGIAAEREAA